MRCNPYNGEIEELPCFEIVQRSEVTEMEFLELIQDETSFYGLVDCGAATNCMGGRCVEELRIESKENKKVIIEGIGGRVTTRGKVIVEFMVGNGQLIKVEFTIVDQLGKMILLGLPFLRQIAATVDFRNGWIESKIGKLEMTLGWCHQRVKKVWYQIEQQEKDTSTSREEEIINSSVLDEHQELEKINFDNANIGEDKQEKVMEILQRFKQAWVSERRGAVTTTKHEILLSTQRSLATKPRRFTEDQQRIIEEEVQSMEAGGVIEDSHSRFATDVLLVKKPNGKWRVCGDYRLLNQYTLDDKYPMPNIQELLRAMRGSSFFVTLDLRAGYWQILMAEKAKEMTAFRTPRGLKQMKVMPFGLKTAPATFQRVMNEILGDLHWNGVLVYLDDIMIHGTTFDFVLERLVTVLSRLVEVNLTINLEKCVFFPKRVKYLGYFIEAGVLTPNPEKVKVIDQLVPCKTAKDVRSLLGMFGFYRSFIRNFSSIAEPLTRLTKKRVKFQWEQEQETAKKELVQRLQEAVLYNPVVGDTFKLETDASDIAVAGIVSCSTNKEGWRPVEFMSKTLNSTQRRWPVHEREAFAIVESLRKFDVYLRGRQFEVFTDNSSLQWMMTAESGKIARWVSRMSEFNFTIKHKKGAQMEHVDFLSRYVCPEEEEVEDRMTVWVAVGAEKKDFPSVEEIKRAQQEEPPSWGRGFARGSSLIFYRAKAYAPPALRPRILAAGHELNPLVHYGMRKTKTMISKAFCWPRIDRDIADYVQNCLSCQRAVLVQLS